MISIVYYLEVRYENVRLTKTNDYAIYSDDAL